MTDIQNHESPLHQTAGPEATEGHSVEPNQPPVYKRLDGEVKRQGEMPFSGGAHCEVWIGIWEKGGGEKGRGKEVSGEKVDGKGMDGEKADSEKVSLNLVTVILLTWLGLGGLESTSNGQVARESA